MHTKRYALLLAAVLAFGSTACAQESTDGTTEAATEAAADVAQNAARQMPSQTGQLLSRRRELRHFQTSGRTMSFRSMMIF